MAKGVDCDTVSLARYVNDADMLDDTLSHICSNAGIIKKKILEMSGSNIQAYSNRRRRNSITPSELKKIEESLKTLGKKIANYKLVGDHFDAINNLKSEYGIEKKHLVETLEVHNTYFTDYLQRNRVLPADKQKKLYKELKRIGGVLQDVKLEDS